MQVAVFGRNFPSYARENIATMFSKFSMLNVDVWVFEPLYEFLQKKTGLRPRVAGLFTEHDDLPEGLGFSLFTGGGRNLSGDGEPGAGIAGFRCWGLISAGWAFSPTSPRRTWMNRWTVCSAASLISKNGCLLKVEASGVDLENRTGCGPE